MISNKLITIVKDNQFDKGWTLFSPASFELDRNIFFKKAEYSNVIRLITYSTQVNIVLAEPCLPSRVIEELKWANKYAKINIIVKNKEILTTYDNLSFSSSKVDEVVNFNYIGITGAKSGYFLIGNDFSEIDDTIEKTIFSSKKDNDTHSLFENAKTIIACSNKHQVFKNTLSLAKKYNLVCRYVVNVKYFDRDTFDYAKENKIELYVSEYVVDSILVVNKDDSICRLSVLDNGVIVSQPIARISDYVGKLYKNLFLNDTIDVKTIPSGVYSCFGGVNEALEIRDAVVIRRDVRINEMSNFVNEVFDSSLVDKHNDYSNKGRTTQYFFTLIPPLFDETYRESSIYSPIHELHKEWNSINTIKFDRVIRDYREFMNEDSQLIKLINYSKVLNNEIEQMISTCDYSNFYSKLEEALGTYEDYRNNILNDCSFMFNKVNSENSGSKFSKFDDEIEGYRKTIEEKEKLISAHKDVLSNQRRIDILNKKIEDLLLLKAKFEENSASRTNKETDAFIAYCMKLVDGVSPGTSDGDSITKIVNTSEESKLTKLNSFVTSYLKQINEYVKKCLICLKGMKSISIPENYPVFEKNSQRYIVINELDEYESTKELCKTFSLKCLARR